MVKPPEDTAVESAEHVPDISQLRMHKIKDSQRIFFSIIFCCIFSSECLCSSVQLGQALAFGKKQPGPTLYWPLFFLISNSKI